MIRTWRILDYGIAIIRLTARFPCHRSNHAGYANCGHDHFTVSLVATRRLSDQRRAVDHPPALRPEQPVSRRLCALLAVAAHALTHVLYWRQNQGPDLHFFAALSWIALAMAALTAVMTAKTAVRARRAGLSDCGVVGARQLAAGRASAHPSRLAPETARQSGPAGLRQPVDRHPACPAVLAAGPRPAPPPSATAGWAPCRRWCRPRQLLFKTLGASWLLLTLTLVTGLVFVQDMLAQHLWHKTVLTALSWLVLLILLIGRMRYGWRGARAVHWTLGAMALAGAGVLRLEVRLRTCPATHLISFERTIAHACYSAQPIGQALDGDDFHVANCARFGRIGFRHDGALEAVRGGFLQALLAVRHRADLAGQPDFAEGHGLLGQRPVLQRADSTASSTGRSAAVSCTRMPPTTFTNTSWSYTPRRRGGAAPPAAWPAGSAPGPASPGADWPAAIWSTSACTSTSSGRVPSRVTMHHAAGRALALAGQEDGGRVGDFLQAVVGHREHAQFVDRAEAVLERAQHAEAAAAFALEIQHRIDHMLEHARAGDAAFLGDVADQEHRWCRFPWRSAPVARRIRAPG